VSYSETSARLTLRAIGTTPEEIRRLAGTPKPIPQTVGRPRLPVVKVKPPETLEERRKAAKEAVRLVKEGKRVCPSLAAVGLSACYSTAVGECVAGNGKITRLVRKGNLSDITPHARQMAVFIRWFYDINLTK